MYMYTQIASDLQVSPRKRSRNIVATLSRKEKKEEEEMICTGRAAYTETKALYMCVCVFVCVFKPRASCIPQNVGESKGIREGIHLASLTV